MQDVLNAIDANVDAMEQAVKQGVKLPDDFAQALVAISLRLDNVREIASGTNYRSQGLDARKMRDALNVSPAGLKWLIEHGHVPPTDCIVPSYEWRSCGKYAVSVQDDGWSPELAAEVVAKAGELREIYGARHEKCGAKQAA